MENHQFSKIRAINRCSFFSYDDEFFAAKRFLEINYYCKFDIDIDWFFVYKNRTSILYLIALKPRLYRYTYVVIHWSQFINYINILLSYTDSNCL